MCLLIQSSILCNFCARRQKIKRTEDVSFEVLRMGRPERGQRSLFFFLYFIEKVCDFLSWKLKGGLVYPQDMWSWQALLWSAGTRGNY